MHNIVIAMVLFGLWALLRLMARANARGNQQAADILDVLAILAAAGAYAFLFVAALTHGFTGIYMVVFVLAAIIGALVVGIQVYRSLRAIVLKNRRKRRLRV